jgi:hypothetical protein
VQGEAQLHQELHLELQVLGTMQHKHIVTLLGWCPEENCLVTELAEKGNLKEGSSHGWTGWPARVSPRRCAVAWCTSICGACALDHITHTPFLTQRRSAALRRPSSSA